MYRKNKGGLNTKLHAVCNQHGKPAAMALTAGQVSDYKGASLPLNDLPQSPFLLADRGYDANWFRQLLIARGRTPCIPSGRNRKITVSCDKELDKQRHKAGIMFGR